jgi:hypothetical protein
LAVQQYIVTLKRTGERTIDGLSLILCLVSAMAFSFVQFKSGQLNYFLFSATAVLLGGSLVNAWRMRKGSERVRFRMWLFVCGISWIFMPLFPWLSLGFFVLAILESQVKHPLELGFSGEGVVINRMIKKSYPWSAFSHILLRDGMLTLDFKDNRIFQREVLDEEDPDADEDEFNQYCRERLSPGREAPPGPARPAVP